MSEIKKVFDATRSYRGHSLEQASKELGVSATFLHKFLNQEATSAPLDKKIKRYIYKSELRRSVEQLCKELDLDPDMKMKKQTA